MVSNKVETSEVGYWIYSLVFFFVYILLLVAICRLVVAHYQFRYDLPVATPGTLQSDLGSWAFTREWLQSLYLLILISGLFMIWTRSQAGFGVHLATLVLFGILWIVMTVFDGVAMVNANVDPADPNFDPRNPAHDPRYCCVYGNQPSLLNRCATTCGGQPPPNELHLDSNFLFRFIMSCILFALLIFDLFYSILSYRRALAGEAGEGEGEGESGGQEMETPYESAEALLPTPAAAAPPRRLLRYGKLKARNE